MQFIKYIILVLVLPDFAEIRFLMAIFTIVWQHTQLCLMNCIILFSLIFEAKTLVLVQKTDFKNEIYLEK